MHPRRFALSVLVLLLGVVASGCLEEVQGRFGRTSNARTGAGDNAVDFLSDAKYTKLVVEIDSVEGANPNAEALNRLKEAFTTHLNKPGGISYDTSGLGSVPGRGGTAKYSFKEIDQLEAEHRQRYARGDTAVLYVLYIDGGSTEDTSSGRVLGAVYHGTSMVMFKGNIKEITKPDLLGTRPEERCVERAVLVHEAGHALGLVNHGIDMVRNHEDPDHKGHSANRNSVMYYAVENSASLLNIFTGGCDSIPHQFDADDKADMKAAGGK